MADESFIIEKTSDVNRFAESPQAHVHFQIDSLPIVEFSRFVQTLAAKASLFHGVTTITVRANILWNRLHAKDFMEILSVLPNLCSFVWLSNNNKQQIPIPHLTILCTRCPRLESLTLQGLSFLSTRDTLVQFCHSLKNHSHLKLFRCWDCSVTETSPAAADSSTPIMDAFVDGMLNAVIFVDSLECIDIRVAPNSSDSNDLGRALLGLCRSGTIAVVALERFQQLLRDNNESCPKIRLWIADGYQPVHNSQQLLLDVAPILAQNTFVQDFRVRGSAVAAGRFVTEDVVEAYREILDSGENTCLTCCDLMTQQGDRIDFYCRLNSMGRRTLMQQLQEMTREKWVEDILLRFANDLDALFYWNRLHPVFFT